ncbi:MAG: protein-L-isoaspartate(D-aspartate) O-methyltransferase [Betaproteobacteria bacterium]|nr:protein-L-isoaspartate(D-aspartate) O-methyltransferase [Betaproteobacteria bacterium]
MDTRRRTLLAAVAGLLGAGRRAQAQDAHADARARLVREVEAGFRDTAGETGRARMSPCVRQALERVQRHRFVPPSLVDSAYVDRPLPIGMGQTISQPFIVALMTELADPAPDARVLEVGTGSGYQAAVLAECVAKVYTIEIVAPLGERARALLAELGYRNVDVRIGDGYKGWPEAAPFDAIVVTAAPDHVPQPLVDQLKPGGRMVIPVGQQAGVQQLLLITKGADGRATMRRTIAVRFVPLTRER